MTHNNQDVIDLDQEQIDEIIKIFAKESEELTSGTQEDN